MKESFLAVTEEGTSFFFNYVVPQNPQKKTSHAAYSKYLKDNKDNSLDFERIYAQIEKEVCSSCHERETKKKFWVPMRNRTSLLRIPRSDALPLSHRDSMVSRARYKVYIWQASCIMRGCSSSSLFLYRAQNLPSFLFSLQNMTLSTLLKIWTKFVLEHHLFPLQFSTSFALGTDKVRGQISEHIFAPNVGYRLQNNP